MNDLKVALIAMNMSLGQTQSNLDFIEEMAGRADNDTDLIVLPEMCTTGYTIDPPLLDRFVEAPDGESMTRLRRLSDEKNIAIAGTFACNDGGKYYNRGFFIDPDSRQTIFYDKRHLFSVGRENMLYTRGMERPPLVTFRGWKLTMVICYDLRFPVWCRNVDCAYDALIVPANWPDARSFAWRRLLEARAIENQAYVLACNRLGSDSYGNYSPELTYAFNHWGDNIGEHRDGIVYARLERERLDHDRHRFGPWRDADPFSVFVD